MDRGDPVMPRGQQTARPQGARMVHFVCSRCERSLVWAEVWASVKCPSCGRWVNANRFWRDSAKKRRNKNARPQQMEWF